MRYRSLVATLWCWSTFLGAADTAVKDSSILHFDMVYRKDSDLGTRLIRFYEQAFRKYGYVFVAEQFPARRGLEELKNNRVDGTAGRVGNLVTIFGVPHYFRLDVPVVYTTMSLWCNKDAQKLKSIKNPRIAYLHGSTYATQVVNRIEDKTVIISTVAGYRNMVVMMRNDRIDCLVASLSNMDTENVGPNDLKGFWRHNLVTMPSYPWLARRFLKWKEPLEKELQQLTSDREWKKLYLEDRARCTESFDVLCPDGRIFSRQLTIYDDPALSVGAE